MATPVSSQQFVGSIIACSCHRLAWNRSSRLHSHRSPANFRLPKATFVAWFHDQPRRPRDREITITSRGSE